MLYDALRPLGDDGSQRFALRLGFLDASERNTIVDYLADGRPIALCYFEIDNFSMFARLFGEDISCQLLDTAREGLAQVLDQILPMRELFHLEQIEPGRFLVLCADAGLTAEDLPHLGMRARLGLKGRLKPEALKHTGQVLEVHAGHAILHPQAASNLEPALYNALCDAQRISRGDCDDQKLSLLQEFRRIVETPLLASVYQPILNFSTGRVMAWEALSRGPAGHPLHSPAALFDYAEEIGQIFALERVCRENAIRRVGQLSEGQKLFINIHPRTLVDPHFSAGETMRFLKLHGLGPDQIVFEITERHSIRDFTLFHRTLEHYRGQGFQVAIDDVGTGYSGLWSIAELRPDYLKVDMSLVRGIDENPIKRALLETFVAFSDKIGCQLIAEGIETQTELSCLRGMGVHAGQGYYLARPGYPKPMPSKSIPPRANPSGLSGRELKCSIPVSRLAVAAYNVDNSMLVRQAKETLSGDDPISAIVVSEKERPVGLVMSHHLDRALSTRYGMSLYFDRSVDRIMDPAPLVVEGVTPVQNVARLAMNRERYKVYDHIIVTEQGKLFGIVSVQNILDTLATVQVEMAKGANPLSGLPGNVAIELEIERRTQLPDPFSVVYADLDNFKVYNDTYGFKNGDNVLLLLSRILTWASGRHGGSDDFVGHVGGDDFVAITSPQRAERICRAVTRCFKRLVRACYSPEDLARGTIRAKHRSGVWDDFPLVSVSMAIVDCAGSCDLAALSGRAAEMKTYAKSIQGNSFVRDRRHTLGQRAK